MVEVLHHQSAATEAALKLILFVCFIADVNYTHGVTGVPFDFQFNSNNFIHLQQASLKVYTAEHLHVHIHFNKTQDMTQLLVRKPKKEKV